MSKKSVYRGTATVLSSLFVIMLSLSVLAIKNESDLNQYLNTESYKVVNNDKTTDTQYYKKKTASLDEHMNQKLDLIERLVEEGTVLVKNDGVLPLKTQKKVTLLGKASADLVYNGSSGNGTIGNAGNDAINITLKAGLENAGFSVNPSMWTYYTANKTDESTPDKLPSDDLAGYSEAAILVLSRNAGEGADAAADYYEMTDTEKELVKKAEAISENVIVIVNSPSALSIGTLKDDASVDAVIQVGGVGSCGANALGKILKGTVSPSGRLIDTYAADSHSSPAYQTAGTATYDNAADITAASPNADGEGNTKYQIDKEGIYVGYKYYETRYEDAVLNQGNASSNAGICKSPAAGWSYASEVSYPFGFGLSYTSFKEEFTDFSIKDNVITASVKVTNTGSVAGKDVVELYAQTPYTSYDKTSKVEKAAVQLVDFAKTSALAPAASETVALKMDLYNIASYDYSVAKTWILDQGDYYFALGSSAHSALNNILAQKGKSKTDGMDENGDASLTKTWNNPSFLKMDKPEFSAKGYTTKNGLFHNVSTQEITNELEDADLNKLLGADKVTYLSRSDWAKTWPTGETAISADANMKTQLTFGYYKKGEKVGSDVKYAQNTTYSIGMMRGYSYDNEMWDKILNQMMIEEMVVTVGKNFGEVDPILGISFPGTSDNDGVGSGPCVSYKSEFNTGKTPFTGITKYSDVNPKMYPSETVEASTFSEDLLYELGESFSEESFYTGLTTIWGPGLNIHRTPYSGRNFEYFSEDSMLSYIMGAELTAAMQSNGLIACPKHFCFNNSETDRYGYSVYTNEQAAREISLRAFEGAVSVAKAKNVMTSLNRIGCKYVGACSNLQDVIMRGEWGFDGYTITDNALGKYQYGRSIVFGTDKLMLLPGNSRSSELNKTSLLDDSTLYKAVRQACHRILYVYVNSKAMNGVSSDVQIVAVTPWWKGTLIGIDIGLGILGAGFIALFAIVKVKEIKPAKKEENA
jgi:beta-glucosidase